MVTRSHLPSLRGMWVIVFLAMCLNPQMVWAALPPYLIDVAHVSYHVGSLPDDPELGDIWKPVTDFTYGELSGKNEA